MTQIKRDILCSKTGIQYSNLSSPQMDIIQFDQILSGVFVELDKLIFKLYAEEGKPRKAKAHLKENQREESGLSLPDIKPYNKGYRNWEVGYEHRNRQLKQFFKKHRA